MWRMWIAAGVLLAGCSDSSGPSPQTYAVAASQTGFDNPPDGSIVADYDLRVTDNGGTRLEGAIVLVAASHGTVSPEGGVSGPGGLLSVHWSITAAERGSATDLTLLACAGNTNPATCTPGVVAMIHISGG